MNIENELMEKIKRFEDVKNQITDLQKKIGGLQEQQRAIYNKGLELKGQIDLLLQLQQQEKDDLAKSQTAKLTLPEGMKPIIPESAPTAPAAVPEEIKAVEAKSPLEVI